MKCAKCNIEHTGVFGSGKFCSRKCANSRTWSQETIQKKRESALTSRKVWLANKARAKSKIKYTCPVCKKDCLSLKKKIYCSKKCYLHDADHKFRKVATGGYRTGSGRSKTGYYRGIYCGSSYELCWVIYNLDHSLEVKRFEGYLTDGILKYYPDFIQNNMIIEIKGYAAGNTVQKKKELAESLGYAINILYKDDLKDIFAYVGKKFGFTLTARNCHRLIKYYDDYKPQFLYVCNFCQGKFTRDKKSKTERTFCSRFCAGSGNYKGI